jgi:hypothetical protein
MPRLSPIRLFVLSLGLGLLLWSSSLRAEPTDSFTDDVVYVMWSCPDLMDTWVKLPSPVVLRAGARKPAD